MFWIFASVEKKTRTAAKHWLDLADKVRHYRRDCMSEAELGELEKARGVLAQRLKEKAELGKLKLAIEGLEEVLRRVGGRHYPKSGLVEWVEFFVVAAIVILGIRAYFVQPFKIPTNSMWPTYNGMTPEVYLKTAEEPSLVESGFRFLAFGASARRVDAPASGEVMLPVARVRTGSGVRTDLAYQMVKGKTWVVLPAMVKEYFLLVGDRWVSVKVPADFNFNWAVGDAFFRGNEDFFNKVSKEDFVEKEVRLPNGERTIGFLKTGKMVRKGERMLSFDILTGDQLFVDRMSYHFVRPKVGDGFVFRTGNINIPGVPGDQYYVKRLAGVPGDKLQVNPPVLLRNGKPVDGAKAFEMNNGKEGKYRGYFNGFRDANYPKAMLFREQVVEVPKGKFVALGDNSANSLDSRYWGFVPEQDVVGRPLFIYYPFTRHWGVAR